MHVSRYGTMSVIAQINNKMMRGGGKDGFIYLGGVSFMEEVISKLNLEKKKRGFVK